MTASPIDRDGQLRLPEDARRALHSEAGAPVEVEVLGDGIVLLRGRDPEQAWFWSPEWQAGEAEVDREIATGQYRTFDSEDDFAAALERIPAADDPR